MPKPEIESEEIALPFDTAPQTEAEVYAQAEGKVSALKRELNEMRVIGARLDELPVVSRQRVLRWLSEHYLAPSS